jgi:type ISP restriction-modification system protein/N-6 DNA methylase
MRGLLEILGYRPVLAGGDMPRSRAIGLTRVSERINVVISEFGRDVTKKLRTGQGSEEDHLRGPFELMLGKIATSLGLKITTIGETSLPDLSIRPDYAIDVDGARVGYVELKKPGHGVPEGWRRPTRHDVGQWEKYKLLPNVLYLDGESFARFNFGVRQGNVARLEPGLDRAGDKLHAVGTDFARVITDFLLWVPEKPRSMDHLVRLVANLCRLLREDIAAELERERSGQSDHQTFTGLAMDWRAILFPNLTDEEFADQYSQTITFALLLARVEGVSFQGRSVGEIARLLGKKHSLMGRALAVLTDQPEEEHSVALTTMLRVLSVVDWADFPDDSYSMLYENFLATYDPALRKQSGVYYTPAALVSFMTRFVDDVLRLRLGRDRGFADRDVIVVDPAMGTGSFLAEVVNTVAATVAEEEGAGAVPAQLRDLSDRLIGFENQAAPYAVAELRIHSLLKKRHRAEVPAKERRFLADTLDDPDTQMLPLGSMYEAIERSRRGANAVKRDEPVMVVMGNPPYVDKIKGISSWIERKERNREASPSLSFFRQVGNGRREYVLSNKYVYFWRWATWKAFDAHAEHPAGVVAFVCSAGFLAGPGFAGMREYLRRTTDEGWIVDLTPEGHQPPMTTRFFRANQQPICVAIFIRCGKPDSNTPARVHRTAVHGQVEVKAEALTTMRVDGPEWQLCQSGWTAAFQPEERGGWSAMPGAADLLPWVSSGVKPNRTWVYAPDRASLSSRWQRIVKADRKSKAALFRESQGSTLHGTNPTLPGIPPRFGPFIEERGDAPEAVRVGLRAFDRQWLIPDSRLIARPRPGLWATRGPKQIFVVEQHAHVIDTGPALLFTSVLPDMHYHSGRGGRVLPLLRDGDGTAANVTPGLLRLLSDRLCLAVEPVDLVAYLAAVTAHPGFVRRFVDDLRTPGVRIPLTSDPELWEKAIRIGREVIWLHTFGERCAESSDGRRSAAPRMRADQPRVMVPIPDTEEGMPDEIDLDAETRTLHVGAGRIRPVSSEVWTYRVASIWVVKHWFGYRRKNPSGNRKGPLDEVVATTWTATMTTELLDLLNVLGRCVDLEPHQDDLLAQVVSGPLITVDDLTTAGVLPVPAAAHRAPRQSTDDGLFTIDV